MIAACPKCQTRYRVQPEQLGPDGARLRCSSCNAVFRVRPPAAAAAADGEAARRAAPPADAGARGAQAGAGVARRADAAGSRSGEAAEPRRPDRLEGRRGQPVPDVAAELGADRHEEESEVGPTYDRERLVLVAHAEPDTSKTVADALEEWGLQTLVAHDGVEAMLAIQRALPRAVVIDAALPRMYGFQVCEIVKRNDSLRDIRVVLVGAIHKEERYRRAPRDLYGADVYVEPPDLPDALLEILTRFGLPVRSGPGPAPSPVRPDGRYGHVSRGGSGGPAREPRTEPLLGEPPAPEATRAAREAPVRARTGEAAPMGSGAPGARPASAAAPSREARQLPRSGGVDARRSEAPARAATPAAAKPADPLAAERAKAERLARIIVSDIVLYNPEKFDAAARSGGDVVAAMRDELEEGRALFRDRIDAQVREERDYLAEELKRAAKARSGR